MTTKEFARGFAKRFDRTIVKSQQIVDDLFTYIRERIAQGEEVTIRSFGTFASKRMESRKGRNPLTGAQVGVPARMVPTFKFSGPMKHLFDEK